MSHSKDQRRCHQCTSWHFHDMTQYLWKEKTKSLCIDWGELGKALQRWLTILSARAHEAWYTTLGEIKMFRQWVNPELWNTVNAILHRGSINMYLLIAFSFYHGSLWFHRLGTFPDNNFWEKDRSSGLIDVRMISHHNQFKHAYVGTQLEYHNITTWLRPSLLLCSEYKFQKKSWH